ncbi:MAG TPA: hypothetical protein VFV10_06735 [Gammaproteobacteria bacterium]|nr:hypothetical protein [Gammaproteobacteria bacterium]
MLNVAVVAFAVAALGGLYLALHVLRGKLAPWAVSVLHAALGATGLVTLLLFVLDGGGGSVALWALGLLFVAALGGFFLATLHLRSKLAPKVIVGVHAVVAVTGFVVLLTLFAGA